MTRSDGDPRGDLETAAALLSGFGTAAASDDGAGAVATGLKLAGVCGFRGKQAVLERSGSGEVYREWHRLAASTRLAAERGDPRTVALAFLFADLWQSQVAPADDLDDLDELGFPAPPVGVQADFAALAIALLADQDPGWIVAQGTAATIRTTYILDRAARVLAGAAEAGVPVEASIAEKAQRIRDRW